MLKFLRTYSIYILTGLIVISLPIIWAFYLKNKQTELIQILNDKQNYFHGPEEAAVTVVEFLDPECEPCAGIAPLVRNQIQKYTNQKVKWIFRYGAYHLNSKLAIQALEASRKQNLYLETLEVLFLNQKSWATPLNSPANAPSRYNELMNVLEKVPQLNLVQLKKDMNEPDILKLIEKDDVDGATAEIPGTPALFVNGVLIDPNNLETEIAQRL